MSSTWAEDLTHRIAAQIRLLRGDQSAAWLSEETAALGHRVSRSTISELENGKRSSITLDAVIVLAAALGVSVADLLYPDQLENVEVLPGRVVERHRALFALAWGPVDGQAPSGERGAGGNDPLVWRQLAESALEQTQRVQMLADDAIAASDATAEALRRTTSTLERTNARIADLKAENDRLRAQLLEQADGR